MRASISLALVGGLALLAASAQPSAWQATAALGERFIPRVLPEGALAVVDADAWEQPRLMAFLQAQGNIEPGEMARTFNCGIGMAVVVAESDVAEVTAALQAAGETVHRIGHIAGGAKGCTVSG